MNQQQDSAVTKRRLLLPSLGPQGRTAPHNNGDDNATVQSSTSTGHSAEGEHTVTSLSSTTSSSCKSGRVLRYGETIDSLFCLDAIHMIDAGHRELCQAICSEKCDDAKAWGEVLLFTLANSHSNPQGDNSTGKRIIHLHRRATSRFKLKSVSSNHDDILKIWLLYAIALLTYDSTTAAIDTYKHIQRLVYANESREFYTALFSLSNGKHGSSNGDIEGGVLQLKQAVTDGVKMVDVIQQQWRMLDQSGLLQQKRGKQIMLPSLPSSKIVVEAKEAARDSTTIGSKTSGTNHQNPTDGQKFEAQEGVISADTNTQTRVTIHSSKGCTLQSGLGNQSVLSSRHAFDKSESETTQDEVQKHVSTVISKRGVDGLNQTTVEKDVSSSRANYESRKKQRSERLASRAKAKKKKEVSISAILSQTINDDGEEESDRDIIPSSASKKNQSGNDHFSSYNKNWPEENTKLPSSAPDEEQARKHFKENISPIDEPEGSEQSVKDMDLGYLLNWDPSKRDKKVRINVKEEDKKPISKITRNDLGYMMNWEPFPDREQGSSDNNIAPSKQKSRNINNMSRIEEEVTEEDNGTTAHSSGSTSSSSQSNAVAGEQKRTSLDTHASSNSQAASRDTTKSSGTPDMPQVENSFLPLIEKNNIITVDNEPYAKLGVIGKGGSCKVYRALSTDCHVVALKKVKLDGLNKATIDGYANEIALLKRLKNNPAIIQLYSSEVDLVRNSIYLVMELGEVDLNYVLMQQSMKQGRSNLNMNFIRLTWQQMLTAVHSIHEERIVHSDLKPANFLFVKGALKLIDFGIAKAIESQDTTNVYRETLSGTLSYMSPEAITDISTNSNGVRVNKCGRASDIWSLGCILYQMVYGKTPFADCQGIHQKLFAITNSSYEINYPGGVDEAAIDAMKSCLERNPKLRATIVGKNGLLNEHIFLHSKTRR